jgi:hypothetical protein
MCKSLHPLSLFKPLWISLIDELYGLNWTSRIAYQMNLMLLHILSTSTLLCATLHLYLVPFYTVIFNRCIPSLKEFSTTLSINFLYHCKQLRPGPKILHNPQQLVISYDSDDFSVIIQWYKEVVLFNHHLWIDQAFNITNSEEPNWSSCDSSTFIQPLSDLIEADQFSFTQSSIINHRLTSIRDLKVTTCVGFGQFPNSYITNIELSWACR